MFFVMFCFPSASKSKKKVNGLKRKKNSFVVPILGHSPFIERRKHSLLQPGCFFLPRWSFFSTSLSLRVSVTLFGASTRGIRGDQSPKRKR